MEYVQELEEDEEDEENEEDEEDSLFTQDKQEPIPTALIKAMGANVDIFS